MTDTNYKYLKKRRSIEVVTRACYGKPALISYRSLPTRFKERVVAKYGDPEVIFGKYMLRDRIVKDIRAEHFFATYTFDGKGIEHLPPAKQHEYTMNASVLNILPAYYSERLQFVRVRGSASTGRIWTEVCSDLAVIQKETGCRLPENPAALRRKMEEYSKDGYYALISKKFRNSNARKAKTEQQEALIRELIGGGQNMNNETVANLYNLIASRMGWESITGHAVADFKRRMPETFPGRHGKSEFFNQKTMQIKRSRPTCPLYFWSMDGWDTELLYKDKRTERNGHSVTTYHNRLTVVVVLDPFNDYIIGYAIGDMETPALIRRALRNAFRHTAELLGSYYKPWQLQTDNYGGKELKEFFSRCAHYYTPARVKNAKAKTVEPFFNRFNNTYLRRYKNSSGYGVKSGKLLQPSDDFINSHKHEFPDRAGCIEQIEANISVDRDMKRGAYLEKWNSTAESDRLPFGTGDFLFMFGETAERPHRLHGHGITLQVEGEKYVYDCFDTEFRTYGHRSFILRYDPENMDCVLAVENTGTAERPEQGGRRFLLERKYVQPMALKDRKPGDYEQLQRVQAYNDEIIDIYTQKRAASGDTVRSFFEENADRLGDTLTKLVITDSLGRHKDVRNEVSGRGTLKALAETVEAVTDDGCDVVADETDFLKDF
jgi:transposase InsO family protein